MDKGNSAEYSVLHGTTTPDNCDREPVNIPGCICPHGFLLVLSQDDFKPLWVGANSADFGLPVPEELLQHRLKDVLPSSEAARLTALLRDEALTTTPEWLGEFEVRPGQRLDIHAHKLRDRIYLEFEPIVRSDSRLDVRLRQLLSSLDQELDTQNFCEALAEGLQKLTGLDRVMAYRFADDWSGEVIAEATSPREPVRFLGLRFPAMDIPKPARDIYSRIRVRALPDSVAEPVAIYPISRQGEPLDMTHCILRGASEMYSEYLANMGILSSVTASLQSRGNLWGLIACHHNEPFFLSPQQRSSFELVSQVASIQLDRMLTRRNERAARELEEVCVRIADLASRQEVPEEKLLEKMNGLLEADGVAYCRDERFYLSGLGPTADQWHYFRRRHLLAQESQEPLFCTDQFKSLATPKEGWPAEIGGFLCLGLSEDFSECLIWFRKEVVREIKWGGDPHEKVVKVGKHGARLHPRKSFETYVETVADRCKPWAEEELYLVRRVRHQRAELLSVRANELAAVNKRLSQANEELDAFATIASHDLKEPIRGLSNYTKFLTADYGHILDEDGLHMLRRMSYLTEKMEGLLESLLEYSKLNRSELKKSEKPLRELVDHALLFLDSRVKKNSATIVVQPDLPRVYGHIPFVEAIITNLISNALKYSRRESPTIEISGHVDENGRTVFSVKDDGIGIPDDKHEVIFDLLVRLHNHDDEFDEGYGVGLAVVKKMVERHNGTIEIQSTLGEGTEFIVTI